MFLRGSFLCLECFIYMPEIPFERVTDLSLNNRVIILDIDGTIVADNTLEIDPQIQNALNELQKTNVVYLSSNSRNHGRNEAIARNLGIPLLKPRIRKPSKQVFLALPREHRHDLVVIGDKFLTDGLFAIRIHVPFIKVRRRCGQDRWFITFLYQIDNIIFHFCKTWVTSI